MKRTGTWKSPELIFGIRRLKQEGESLHFKDKVRREGGLLWSWGGLDMEPKVNAQRKEAFPEECSVGGYHQERERKKKRTSAPGGFLNIVYLSQIGGTFVTA